MQCKYSETKKCIENTWRERLPRASGISTEKLDFYHYLIVAQRLLSSNYRVYFPTKTRRHRIASVDLRSCFNISSFLNYRRKRDEISKRLRFFNLILLLGAHRMRFNSVNVNLTCNYLYRPRPTIGCLSPYQSFCFVIANIFIHWLWHWK